MALERAVNAVVGCFSKLSHSETRLMLSKLRGHEFVRHWCQAVEVFNENNDKVRNCHEFVRVETSMLRNDKISTVLRSREGPKLNM